MTLITWKDHVIKVDRGRLAVSPADSAIERIANRVKVPAYSANVDNDLADGIAALLPGAQVSDYGPYLDFEGLAHSGGPWPMPAVREVTKGGPGSGHWGHSGRPGKHGGSLPAEGWDAANENVNQEWSANLNLGAKRRAAKMAQVYQAELAKNPEYQQAVTRIKAAEAEVLKLRETSARLDAFYLQSGKAEQDAREATRALERTYLDLEHQKQALLDKSEAVRARLHEIDPYYQYLDTDIKDMPPNVAFYYKKMARIKAQVDKMNPAIDAAHKTWIDSYHRMDALMAARDPEAEKLLGEKPYELQERLTKAERALAEVSRTDGVTALQISMKAAARVRQEVFDPASVIQKRRTDYQKQNSALADEYMRLNQEADDLVQKRKDLYEKSGFNDQSPEFNKENNLIHDRILQIIDQRDAIATKTKQLTERALVLREAQDSYLLALLGNNPPGQAQIKIEEGVPEKVAEYARRGIQDYNKLVGDDPFIKGKTFGVRPTDRVRGWADEDGYHLSEWSPESHHVHELGHVLEAQNPVMGFLADWFWQKRTAGGQTERLVDLEPNRGFENHEETIKDKFIDPYMGKKYPSSVDADEPFHTEITSMGLQFFKENPARLVVDDPEYFDFLYAMLRIGK